MTPRWRKLGQIYVPKGEGRHPKLLTHASNPLPVHLGDDIYRIFYSGRDKESRSSVGAVDMDIVRRMVVRDHQEPFFVHGPDGSFYADGVGIGNCYVVSDLRYMLFMAWQSPPGAHWRGEIGRLIVNSDLTLELENDVPFMPADEVDRISLSYPWVVEDEENGFQMWYGSTRTWDAGNGEMLHVINSASSTDGHHWHREGLAIPYQQGVLQAFSRPTVARNLQGGYGMWFSYRGGRGDKYRIGYAESRDARHWRLALEKTGIQVSAEGWDSEMIEYPFVFDHKDRRYMLYNGNDYGKTGFGIAIQV